MNHFIKPEITDNSDKIEKLEQILLVHSKNLQDAHTMHAQIESEVEIVRKATQKEPLALLELKEQLAFGGFLNICMMDLIVTSKNLLQAKQIWEEVYYVRHTYLTIYEAVSTYSGFSRWIKKAIESGSPVLKTAFNSLSEKVRKFKKDFNYETTMAETRNQLSAHIHGNFTQFFLQVSKIDIDKAKVALAEFVAILNTMQILVRDIAQEKLQIELKKRIN